MIPAKDEYNECPRCHALVSISLPMMETNNEEGPEMPVAPKRGRKKRELPVYGEQECST
jgi:hypothetical protein